MSIGNEERKRNIHGTSNKKLKLTQRGKVTLLAILAGLTIGPKGYEAIKEAKYQRDIDRNKSIVYDMDETDESYNMSDEQRKAMTEYLTAVKQYTENDQLTWGEKEDYERIIIDAQRSGLAITGAQKILNAKLKEAIQLGEYKTYSLDDNVKLIYSKEHEENLSIIMKGIGTFPIEGYNIMEPDVPDNFADLAKKCYYYNKETRKIEDREESLKLGIELGNASINVLSEHYQIKVNNKNIISESVDFRRINDEDYDKLRKTDGRKDREDR